MSTSFTPPMDMEALMAEELEELSLNKCQSIANEINGNPHSPLDNERDDNTDEDPALAYSSMSRMEEVPNFVSSRLTMMEEALNAFEQDSLPSLTAAASTTMAVSTPISTTMTTTSIAPPLSSSSSLSVLSRSTYNPEQGLHDKSKVLIVILHADWSDVPKMAQRIL